jgi:hypothetical protein
MAVPWCQWCHRRHQIDEAAIGKEHAMAEKTNETFDTALVNDTELRRRLGYSSTTIRRLRAKGLPSIGQDRLRRYDWSAVVLWLSQRV